MGTSVKLFEKLFPCLIFSFIVLVLPAQETKKDSLLKQLKNIRSGTVTVSRDTTLLTVLNNLAEMQWRTGNYDDAIQYAGEVLKKSKQLLSQTSAEQEITTIKKAKGKAYNCIGIAYYYKGNYSEAVKSFTAALKIWEETDNKQGIANSYNNIGNLYSEQGNYSDALKNYIAALKIREEIGDKQGIGDSYNNIGLIYDNQGDYTEALKNYIAALKIREAIGDKQGTADSYNNIGLVSFNRNDFTDALKSFMLSLKIRKEIDDKTGIAASYNNIGTVYENLNNYDEALKNHLTALKLKETLGDKTGIAASYNNIGKIYTRQHNYREATKNQTAALKIQKETGDKRGMAVSYYNLGKIDYALRKFQEALNSSEKGLTLADETGNKSHVKEIYLLMAEIYAATGDYAKAYRFHTLYSSLQDTLLNEAMSKNIAKMQVMYESEKKEKEIQLLNKDKEVQAAHLKKQKQLSMFVMGGLVLFLIFFVVLYTRFRIIRQQKQIIEEQKAIVDEKNKDITDSISYARYIQEAMLSYEEKINRSLSEWFVFFKPRDIVSGDFYWYSEKNNKIIIAAVDCTGHGVPGAFMSLIGNDLLNNIVNSKSITQANLILNELHKDIRGILKQEQTGNRDGMDIALCVIDKQNKKLEYAGAKNPLILIQNNNLQIIKADKLTIGGLQEEAEKERLFSLHTFDIFSPAVFYIFSDGFQDQFGGQKGKKFMLKQLKSVLFDIYIHPMEKQKELLETTLKNWKKEQLQTDDICVIGVKI